MAPMNEQTADVLNKVFAKLGVTADHLWNVLVAQAKVDAVMQVGWAIAWIVVAILMLKFFKRGAEALDRMDCDGFFSAVYVVATGLVQIGAIVAFAFAVRDVTVATFNPEFYAFQKVADIVKSK